MFEIKVCNWAPERLQKIDFWCHFLTGTHWRKFGDNAELVLLSVDHCGYGELSCVCKAFNDKYSMGGYGTNQIRDFPIGYSTMGDRTDIDTIVKYGFNLVPDSIQADRYSVSQRDAYRRNMNNLDWGDYNLKRPDTDCDLKGLTPRRVSNEPIAFFNMGIPVGRVVSLKGLVIGNEPNPGVEYEKVWH